MAAECRHCPIHTHIRLTPDLEHLLIFLDARLRGLRGMSLAGRRRRSQELKHVPAGVDSASGFDLRFGHASR